MSNIKPQYFIVTDCRVLCDGKRQCYCTSFYYIVGINFLEYALNVTYFLLHISFYIHMVFNYIYIHAHMYI